MADFFLADMLEDADLIVGFNCDGFDIPCLAGVLERRLVLPRRYDILRVIWDRIPEADRFRKGWGLDAVCTRTLGVGKIGTGEHAPALVAEGRWAEVFDTIRRYFEWRGLDVAFVSNVTDVEDKIIARAAEEGSTEPEVAQRYEAAYWAEMDRLGVRRPEK